MVEHEIMMIIVIWLVVMTAIVGITNFVQSLAVSVWVICMHFFTLTL